jgi:hypothetical protein
MWHLFLLGCKLHTCMRAFISHGMFIFIHCTLPQPCYFLVLFILIMWFNSGRCLVPSAECNKWPRRCSYTCRGEARFRLNVSLYLIWCQLWFSTALATFLLPEVKFFRALFLSHIHVLTFNALILQIFLMYGCFCSCFLRVYKVRHTCSALHEFQY